MKKLLILHSILVTILGYSQTTIVNKKTFNGTYFSNMYLQDTDLDMNAFEGTYQYTNGNITFKIQLVKKTMVPIENYFNDLLIGEVSYKVGLQTLVNTLNKINTIYEDIYDHAIVARMIIDDNNYGLCTDCTPNEIRILGSMFDGNRGSTMWLQKEVINGQQALRVTFMISSSGIRDANDAEEPPKIPGGEYLMFKQ